MTSKLENLAARLEAATGRDRDLDAAIASTIDTVPEGDPVPDYTASVDRCIALVGTALPAWHWHVGHGPLGIVPYASLSRETSPGSEEHLRVEASAMTVPLALLRATVKAMLADRRAAG